MSFEMQLSPQALPALQILQQVRAGGGEVGAMTTMGVQVGDGRCVGIGVHVGANGSGFVATGKDVRDMVVAVCVIVGVSGFVAAGKGVRDTAVGV